MLRLDHDVDQLSLTEKSDASTSPPTTTAHSAPVTPLHNRGNSVDVDYRDGTQRGFFEGLLGCLRPVWTIIGKAAAAELKQQGEKSHPLSSVPPPTVYILILLNSFLHYKPVAPVYILSFKNISDLIQLNVFIIFFQDIFQLEIIHFHFDLLK